MASTRADTPFKRPPLSPSEVSSGVGPPSEQTQGHLSVSIVQLPRPHRPHLSVRQDGGTGDYVCGAIASLVNVTVTFPINKVMFRQQVHGSRFRKAYKQVRREGAFNAFRGLLPPLLQRTATVSLMFGTYTTYRGVLETTFPSWSYVQVHTLAAVGAGTTEAILAPFERVQVVLQMEDYHGRLKNTAHAFRVLSGYGGIPELYRGITAILLRNGPSNVLFLGLREPLKRSLPQPASEFGETVNAFISGAGLGASLSTIFFPLNVVKNRMQARVDGPHFGIWETFMLIRKERRYKWRKLFRGVHINYTRSFLSWGIINATYEFLKRRFWGSE